MPKGYALPHRTWSRSLTRRWVPTATYSDLGKLRQLAVVRLSRGPFNRQFLRTQQVCLERAEARPRGGKRRPRKQFTELVQEGAGRRGVLGKRGPAVACSRRKQGRPRREGELPCLARHPWPGRGSTPWNQNEETALSCLSPSSHVSLSHVSLIR